MTAKTFTIGGLAVTVTRDGPPPDESDTLRSQLDERTAQLAHWMGIAATALHENEAMKARLAAVRVAITGKANMTTKLAAVRAALDGTA